MMLVQKHPLLPMSPTMAHRRNPSAPPAVIVQPTRTPGLLSLSKPPRPSPTHQRQLNAQQRQHRTMPKTRQQPPLVPNLTLSADSAVSDKKFPVPAAPSFIPSPQPRGRAHAKNPKEKTINPSRTLMRSSSNTSLRSRPSRQPSPPIPPQSKISSQAEGPINRPTQSSNLFDPFLDDAMFNKSQPTLTSKPSGKLARRRQPQAGGVACAAPPSPTPVSSKAIPLPASTTRTHPHSLSRSDPALSHMPSELPRRRSSIANFDAFPICDDMTDAGDASDHERSAPATPTRTKAQGGIHNNSARTAPISGAFPAFPMFPSAPNSAPQQHKARQAGRKHKRSPSEGVFNMSSDEDSSSGLNPNVAALFQLAGTPSGIGKKTSGHVYGLSPYRTPAPAIPKFAREITPTAAQAKERQYEKEAAEKVAGYFASSSFQNSPSPDELPDPLFL